MTAFHIVFVFSAPMFELKVINHIPLMMIGEERIGGDAETLMELKYMYCLYSIYLFLSRVMPLFAGTLRWHFD